MAQATHEVFNQPLPLADVNLFDINQPLQDAVRFNARLEPVWQRCRRRIWRRHGDVRSLDDDPDHVRVHARDWLCFDRSHSGNEPDHHSPGRLSHHY